MKEIADYFTSKNFYPQYDQSRVLVNFKGLKFTIMPDHNDEAHFFFEALQPAKKQVDGFDEEKTSFMTYRLRDARCVTLDDFVLELGRFCKELGLVVSENIYLDSLSNRVEALIHLLSKMGFKANGAEGKDCANIIEFEFKGMVFWIYLDWTDYEYFTLMLPHFDMPGVPIEKIRKAIVKINRYKMLKNVRAVLNGESLYFVVEAFHSTGLSFAQVLPRYLREIEIGIRLYWHEIGFDFSN